MGWSAILVAVLVIAGWQFSVELLKTLLPGLTPMNPVVAVLFIACGTWIIAYSPRRRLAMQLLATLVTLIGLLHFLTHLFAVPGIRMDYLLYGDRIRAASTASLIAPNSAFNFLLCGLAMLMTGRHGRTVQFLRQAFLLVAFLLAYASLLGYVFDIQPVYRLGGLNPMALFTTINFLLVILGLLFSDTRYGAISHFASPLSGGRLMRRIIPLILFFPPVVNYVALLGARIGWYSAEFGMQVSTFLFTIFLLLFIGFYAALSNRLQRKEKEQDQRFASLVASINEGIIETDANGIITYVNGAFENILGYTSAEITGVSALEVIIPGKDKQRFQERLENRKRGIEESYTSELVDKSGQKKQVAITAKPMYDSNSRFKSVLVSLRDITEEQRNLKDIKTFTDFAAHDLKAPLVNLTMLVELARGDNANPEQQQILQMMDETAGKMRMLIDDLLQFSRMGAAELEIQPVDTAALVRDVLKESDTSKHRVVVADLPVINANETSCRQLFHNLVSNGLKYSSKADHPELRIDASEIDGRTWFSICDNGVGIDPKFIGQLFQPFKRFSNQFKGSGLGLAIVKRIVEKHGGSIEARLPAEGGMCFHFTLTPEKRNLH